MSNRTLADAIALLKAKQFPLEELFARLESARAGNIEQDGARRATNGIQPPDAGFEILAAKIKILAEIIGHHARQKDMPPEGIFAQAREAGVDLVALRDLLLELKQDLLARREAGAPPPEKSSLEQK